MTDISNLDLVLSRSVKHIHPFLFSECNACVTAEAKRIYMQLHRHEHFLEFLLIFFVLNAPSLRFNAW